MAYRWNTSARGWRRVWKRAVREAIDVMRSLGAEVEETSLPSTRHALAVYYIIAPSEASANLARYDGVKYGFSAQDADSVWDALEKTRQYGFGPEVKRRIMLGTYALVGGVLRRVLPAGAAREDADSARVRAGVHAV